MHEGAIEERIAFAEHHHVFAGLRKGDQMVGDFLVERREDLVVARIGQRDFGGDRVFHREFDGVLGQHPVHDTPRLSGAACLAEEGHVLGVPHQPVGADAQQVLRARAEADAVHCPRGCG